MLSPQIIELEQTLRDYSLEDKRWLLEQLQKQIELNSQKDSRELINSWNEAYSDGLDESEILMLKQIKHHQRQLSDSI